jgi:hypothetical protein
MLAALGAVVNAVQHHGTAIASKAQLIAAYGCARQSLIV